MVIIAIPMSTMSIMSITGKVGTMTITAGTQGRDMATGIGGTAGSGTTGSFSP
jgi:hypothetical protein